jgi:hypothetical protein
MPYLVWIINQIATSRHKSPDEPLGQSCFERHARRRKADFVRLGAPHRSDAAGTAQIEGCPLCGLWGACEGTFQKLICARKGLSPEKRVAIAQNAAKVRLLKR